ncbi:hypothetical protein MBH78_02655 [Oceanimonas sp. NS1]|nr:hypothetical protein [Oceanimonas sp. NS1]
MVRPRTVTDEQRRQIIELKRRHSFAEVATMLGLPIGTVKTVARRSGAFTDNPRHRALFTLPPRQDSTATKVAAVELPEQRTVTGDKELDAMLWLRETIQTGHPAFIDKALDAATRIKTPPKKLERRYAQYLATTTGNTMAAAFGSIFFADLESLAKRVREKTINRTEAAARFGTDDPDMMTEADRFCIRVLKGAEVTALGSMTMTPPPGSGNTRSWCRTPWKTACMSWRFTVTCTGCDTPPPTGMARKSCMPANGSPCHCWRQIRPATRPRLKPCCDT